MRTQTLLIALFCLTCTFALGAPTMFDVSVKNYAYIGKPGLNAAATQISLFTSTDPAAAGGGYPGIGLPVTFPGGVNASNLNGAGISMQDGYMYAMEYLYTSPASASARMFRVGANAQAVLVGNITAPTAADGGGTTPMFSFINSASGMVDASGNYWFTAYTFDDFTVVSDPSKLKVFFGKLTPAQLTTGGTMTPEYLRVDVSDPVLQEGFKNFISSAVAWMNTIPGGNPANANGGWQDMDINPADQKFYSFIAFPNAVTPFGSSPLPEKPLNSYLTRIDLSTDPAYWGKVVLVNETPVATPNIEMDGAYFSEDGSVFYTVFVNGEYREINPATGTYTGTMSTTALPLDASGEMRGDFATNTTADPLPVTILSFTGLAANGVNILQWKTALETRFSHFEIERSKDGKDFIAIGSAMAKGSNSTYTFSDAFGAATYRLRLADQDGSYTYSSVVRLGGKDGGTDIVIYPTILSGNTVTVNVANKNVLTEIFSSSGSVVSSVVIRSVERTTVANIPLNSCAGMYIIRVTDLDDRKPLISEKIFKL